MKDRRTGRKGKKNQGDRAAQERGHCRGKRNARRCKVEGTVSQTRVMEDEKPSKLFH
jgi:hypothetical protein